MTERREPKRIMKVRELVGQLAEQEQTRSTLWGSPSHLVRPSVKPLLGVTSQPLNGYTRPKRAPVSAA